MKHDMPHDEDAMPSQAVAPSADFINAISEFFDTDPSDLLLELGYYKREVSGHSEVAVREISQ